MHYANMDIHSRFLFNFVVKKKTKNNPYRQIKNASWSSKTAKYYSINCKKHTTSVKVEYVNTYCSMTGNTPMTSLQYQKWLRAQSWFHRAPKPPFLPAFYCCRCFDLFISQVGFNIEHPDQVSRCNTPVVADKYTYLRNGSKNSQVNSVDGVKQILIPH